MDVASLKAVMAEQLAEVERTLSQEAIVPRELVDHACGFLRHPNILAVLGVRRCGKSVFAQLLARRLGGGAAYLDLGDERLAGMRTDELNNVLQAALELHGEVSTIVLDEPQNVVGWERFASRLRRTRRVIITGSNSLLLSGELATHLTGRHMDVALYTFSFREVAGPGTEAVTTEDVARTRMGLEGYVKGSGFPEFGRLGPGMVARLHEDIIAKDCVRRHEIRRPGAFREAARYLVSSFSREFTFSGVARVAGLDVHTARDYVGYLEEAFLLRSLERFSPRLKERMKAPRKAYDVDQGFCNFSALRASGDLGRLYENVVFIDLLRRRALEPGTELFYWKDHQQHEVDFAVRRGLEVVQLIQVCYDLAEGATRRRETRSLVKASKELGCRDLLIVTDEEEGESRVDGRRVRCVPLWRWLLGWRAPEGGAQASGGAGGPDHPGTP